MSVRRAALCAVLLFGSGCGDDAASPPGPAAGGGAACGESEELGPDGSCRPVLFAANCEPATMPKLGQSTCEPVGWLDCPSGFTKDPSG